MTNFIRTSWKLVATGIAVALVLAACGSSAPKKHRKTHPPRPHPVDVCQPTASKLMDAAGTHLQSYPTTTNCPGAAIITAYRNYLNTYLQVLANPYGNGNTPRQELGLIYAKEAQGTLKPTQLPTGCVLPANITHAISWPKACDSLLTPSSTASTTNPLGWAASQLSQVATPSGVAATLQAITPNLDGGYTTSGTLPTVGTPILRQVVSPGGSVFTNAPNPTLPITAWVPATATAHAATAVVWACLADHLTATNGSTTLKRTTVALAVNVGLVRSTTGGWAVAGMGVQRVAAPIAKESPCGIAY